MYQELSFAGTQTLYNYKTKQTNTTIHIFSFFFSLKTQKKFNVKLLTCIY